MSIAYIPRTVLKNLLDACGASLAFFSIGYAFAFGGMDPLSESKTFIGSSNFFLQGVDNLGFWLFNYAFSAASATIVAGTIAERCQMIAYLGYSIMLTGLVYPVIARAVWNPNGFLSAYSIDPVWGVGMVDFAGSSVVHCTGGMTALLATLVLGPRKGRFHDDTGRLLDRPAEIKGSSMALQVGDTCLKGDECQLTLHNRRCLERLYCGLAGTDSTAVPPCCWIRLWRTK